MTDDKLRDACERVAKRWLGWTPAAGAYREDGSLCQVVAWCTQDGEIRTADQLASPWGMDLLLDAVEEKNYFVFLESYTKMGDKPETVYYEWTICGPREADIIGKAESENRYTALIFALDEAGEVLDAE